MSNTKHFLKKRTGVGDLQPEERLEQRLIYEKSISRFSEAILKDTPDSIQIGLSSILESTKSSRIYIFRNFTNAQQVLFTQQIHEVCAFGVQKQIDNSDLLAMPFIEGGFERWIDLLSQDKIINSRIDDLPPSEKEVLGMQNIKSILVIPIFVNKEWYGFIGFDDVFERHLWNKEDVSLLKTIAEIIGLYFANKQNQEIIAKRNEELRELNATKDKFFSIIAHDLKSPFSTLLGISKILVDRSDDLDLVELKKLAKIIHNTSENTFNLLDNLLRWANSQTGAIKYNPVSTNMRFVFEENIDIIIEIDRQIIDTVLRNLLSNAIKFSNIGGHIELGSKKLENNVYEFYVKDNGVGIEAEIRANLFHIDKAISTEGTNGESGTGLGLILCKELIEKHKGNIRAESTLGKGSTFFFTLPRQAVL
jgi:signal transduction histidine kinase